VGREIERKFLVIGGAWRNSVESSEHFRQGYLVTGPQRAVRIRASARRAWLAVKAATDGIERIEYEYPVPLPDANHMLDAVCLQPVIEKTRHWVRHGGLVWEIDVFEGENSGLVVAEVELQSEGQSICLPDWVGEEVSDNAKYYNASLVDHPYRRWKSG